MLFLATTLLGLRAAATLPVSLVPRLDLPVLRVETRCPGFPATEVEARVSAPLEEALRGIGGVRTTEARSVAGRSTLTLRLRWGTDVGLAAVAVRERLQELDAELPERVAPPVLVRVERSDRPFLRLVVTGGEPAAVARWVEGDLRRRLEALPDVAEVGVEGAPVREIHVELAGDRLRAVGLSGTDVIAAVERHGAEPLPGILRIGHLDHPARMAPALGGPGDVGGVPVPSGSGAVPARTLGDLASIRETLSPPRTRVRHDGRPGVAVSLLPRPGFHLLRATRRAETAVRRAAAERPGLTVRVVSRDADRARSGLRAAVGSLVLGTALVALLLSVTTRRPRLALSAAVVLPVSLAGAVGLFPFLGVGLHLFSAVGLAVAAGLLVDNAVVVTESVERRLAGAASAAEAVRRGAAEVAVPVTGSTVTTLVVFLPLFGLEGLAGALFRDLAAAVCLGLAFSWLGALTLVPLLAAGTSPSRAPARGWPLDRWLGRSERLYGRVLERVLRRPRLPLAAAGLAVSAGVATAFVLPRSPSSGPPDRSLAVELGGGAGTPEDALERTALHVERLLAVASPVASHWMRYPAGAERDRIDLRIRMVEPTAAARRRVLELLARAASGTSLAAAVREPDRFAPGSVLGSGPVEAVVELGGADRDELARAAETTREALASSPGVEGVRIVPSGTVPSVELEARAPSLRRTATPFPALASALRLRLGRATGELTTPRGVPVPLRFAVRDAEEDGLEGLLEAPVGDVPIRRLVDVRRTRTPRELLRRDGRPAMEVRATPALGGAGALVDRLSQRGWAPALPAGVWLRVRRSDRASRREVSSLLRSAGVGLALVLVVLVIQFESARWPLLALSTVPFAVAGAAAALTVAGRGWDPTAAAGVLLLAGVTVNDAIMKVDAIRRSRAAGSGPREAVRAAGRRRFRPIVLTTATTVLGVLPLVVPLGTGGRPAAGLGLVVAGGLAAGTAASLLVLPALAVRWGGGAPPDGRPPAARGSTEGEG